MITRMRPWSVHEIPRSSHFSVILMRVYMQAAVVTSYLLDIEAMSLNVRAFLSGVRLTSANCRVPSFLGFFFSFFNFLYSKHCGHDVDFSPYLHI